MRLCEKTQAWSMVTQRLASPPLPLVCPTSPLYPKLCSNLREKIAPKNLEFKNVSKKLKVGGSSWLPGLHHVTGQERPPSQASASPCDHKGVAKTKQTSARSAVMWWCSVAQSCLTLCDTTDCSMPRLPCPSPSPGAYSNSCPLSR